MECCILTFVRSLRERNSDMYLDALTESVPWSFALDHSNYACWVPVHFKDMANLSDRNPEIVNKFNAGHFTAPKTNRLFSAIALDQAHKQVNECIKGDGGAVGLTDDPNALRRCGWLLVQKLLEQLENFKMQWSVYTGITQKNLWRANITGRMKVGRSFWSRMFAR